MYKKLFSSKLFLIIICIFVFILFWNIKDKKIYLGNAKLSSTILPLEKNEISQQALNLQEAFVKVAELIRPAVVNISTIHTVEYPKYEFYFGDPFDFFKDFEDFFGTPPKQKKIQPKNKYKTESGGSGVIISPDGYVLTNEHVIHDADEIKVRVNINGREKTYSGKVIGKDERTDIAIIKISGSDKFPAAPLGDSDKIRVGEWVVAIGSPFGLEQTVTQGIISAVRQSIVVENRVYKDFIQTDASINRGNSGGPLCNIKGEVIGINTAIYAPTGVFSGIGFAIPINRAKAILDDLIHKGKVIRGWLGVEIRPVDEAIMRQFGLQNTKGALINNVFKDSPAEKSGLKRGDIIIEFDNKKIENPSHLQDIVSSTKPKKQVNVKIIRNKKEMSLTLTTGEMPEKISELEPSEKNFGKSSKWLGMEVMNINDDLREKYEIPVSETGVVVIDVNPEEKSYEIGLMEGDLITKINQEVISNTDDFDKVVKKINLKEGVVFDIIRKGNPLFLSYTE